MKFFWKTLLTSFVLFFPVAIASAATVPESAISSDVGVVIRLKQPKVTQQNIIKLLNQVDEILSGVLSGNIRTVLGRSISNPTLAGVDTSREMMVGVFLSQDKQPGILYVIPVADEKQLSEALGKKYQSAVHENWMLYSEDQALVEQAKSQIQSSEKSFRGELSDAAGDLFQAGDLSIYVNSRKLVEIYQAQLLLAGPAIDAKLNQFSEKMNAAPGMSIEPMIEMYSSLARQFLQAVRDSQSYTTAFQISAEGVGVESLFEVEKDSETDEFLQKSPPQKLEQLGQFPAGHLMYFAGADNTETLITWGMSFTAQMFDDSKENAEAKARFDSIVKEIHNLKFGNYYFSFELGKLSQGILNAYAFSEVSPSESMRKYSREMMSLMKNVSFPGMRQNVTMTPDAEKVDDVSVDLMVIQQEVDPESDPLRIQKRMLEVLYGGEGITTRMAYPEGKVLQAMGGTASMEKFLTALNAPADSKQIAQNQPAFKAARSHGLERANLLALVDVPMMLTKIVDILVELQQKEPLFTTEQKEKQGIAASYLTFSVATGPQSLRTKTYVPVQNLKSGFKVFTVFSAAREKIQRVE